MARIYATSCEKDGKNFFTVPKRLQNQVRVIIEEDGFDILEDGTVVKHVDPEPEPEPEEPVE